MARIATRTTSAALFAMAACVLAVSGCTAFDLSKPLPPKPGAPVVTVSRDPETVLRETAPRNTGTYPTFGDPLTAANTQLSDQDAAKQQQQLSGLAKARRSGSISEAEYQRRVAEMRKLAAQHGAQTQAEIAN